MRLLLSAILLLTAAPRAYPNARLSKPASAPSRLPVSGTGAAAGGVSLPLAPLSPPLTPASLPAARGAAAPSAAVLPAAPGAAPPAPRAAGRDRTEAGALALPAPASRRPGRSARGALPGKGGRPEGRAAPPDAEAREAGRGASLEGRSQAAGRLFDNAWVDRAEAAWLLGADPARLEGALLSSLSKSEWVAVIRPDRRRDLVVKTFRSLNHRGEAREAAQNELLPRRFVELEPLRPFFEPHFSMPPALAYAHRSFPWINKRSERATVVMEFVDAVPYARFGPRDGRSHLPLSLRVSLFLLAHSLGLADMNPQGLLIDGAARYHLIDTESGRHETRGVPDLLTTADMPWLSRHHLNDMDDFLPALAAFRTALQEAAAAAGELGRMLLLAGVRPRRAAQDLELLRRNVARMEEVLAADVHSANRLFWREVERLGLDAAGVAIVSQINRRLTGLPEGPERRRAAAQRDLIRGLAGTGDLFNDHALWPKELAFVLRRFPGARALPAGGAAGPEAEEGAAELRTWIQEKSPPLPATPQPPPRPASRSATGWWERLLGV